MHKICRIIVANFPQKYVLIAFQFSKVRVCQVQDFKDWDNHGSVYTNLSFPGKSISAPDSLIELWKSRLCSMNSCVNFLLYSCIICDHWSKVFKFVTNFQSLPSKKHVWAFQVSRVFSLLELDSSLSNETFYPNQRQTSEKTCTAWVFEEKCQRSWRLSLSLIAILVG